MDKYRRLGAILASMQSALVALSGGVDSALLAHAAQQALGEQALAVTIDSPSMPRRELSEALALARQIGICHRLVQTDELSDERYAANPPQRCYYCKDIILSRLEALAAEEGLRWICLGDNLDDLADIRPGSQAAREHGARAPLQEAGLGKAEVRQLARWLGVAALMPVWDKPAAACLASRIPYGMRVTAEKLAQVEQAEEVLWALGFRQFRVRHHGDVARIEVASEQMAALLDLAEPVCGRLRALGFRFVALDLDGYRRGSLNEGVSR
jgi:uncharacterized protein